MYIQFKTSRVPLFIALLVILNIAGNVAFVSAQRATKPSERPIEIKTSSPLAAATTIAPVSAAALPDTNGNKVVAGAGGLHAVFTDGNQVKYTKTTDGVTWSPPVTIAANANHPTIAIAGTTIGVAYVASGIIRYISKSQTSTAWSSPVNIYGGGSKEPTMVSYNSKMYLAWALSDTYVVYVSFPAVITATPPGVQQANGASVCWGYNSVLYQPAIAVSATSATDPQPLIRIAYFKREVQNATSSCSGYSNFGYEVTEFRNSNYNPLRSMLSPFSSSGSPGNMSMSMTADPANGDFYLGVSYIANGIDRTELWYENAWNLNDTWRSFLVLPRKAHIDVEASCTKFRLAVSDFTQGVSGYGPTWYRTGTWTGQSAMNPTWDEPTSVSVSGYGANPQALFLSAHTGTVYNGTSHLISTVFDDKTGTAFSIKHDDRSFKGPSIITACPLKLSPDTNPKAF